MRDYIPGFSQYSFDIESGVFYGKDGKPKGSKTRATPRFHGESDHSMEADLSLETVYALLALGLPPSGTAYASRKARSKPVSLYNVEWRESKSGTLNRASCAALGLPYVTAISPPPAPIEFRPPPDGAPKAGFRFIDEDQAEPPAPPPERKSALDRMRELAVREAAALETEVTIDVGTTPVAAETMAPAPASGAPQSFNFGAHEVRVMVIDGKEWWVAKDVCAVLGIANVSQACDRLPEGYSRLWQTETGVTPTPFNQLRIVSEPGLYWLIARSDKPAAKGFTAWVNETVLPSIRKTGSYTAVIAHTTTPLAAKIHEGTLITNFLTDIVKIPHASALRCMDYYQQKTYGTGLLQDFNARNELPVIVEDSYKIASELAGLLGMDISKYNGGLVNKALRDCGFLKPKLPRANWEPTAKGHGCCVATASSMTNGETEELNSARVVVIWKWDSRVVLPELREYFKVTA